MNNSRIYSRDSMRNRLLSQSSVKRQAGRQAVVGLPGIYKTFLKNSLWSISQNKINQTSIVRGRKLLATLNGTFLQGLLSKDLKQKL